MNPRAIALQGIGFGALLVAIQGFGAFKAIDQSELTSESDADRQRVVRNNNNTLMLLMSAFLVTGVQQ